MENLLIEYKKISDFESKIANYTGSKYAVSVDCCTNALLLCFAYLKPKEIILPKNTFIGVAAAAHHTRCAVIFKDIEWSGLYKIDPTNIYDSARRFTKNMYIQNSFICLSFHYKKHLKIGRGGAILTDNEKAYEWFKLARNNGKDIAKPLSENIYEFPGYNMLLHPDLAEKGSHLLDALPRDNCDMGYEYYGDLSRQIRFL
jgi:dTDP-4-amino-4,6-dideoxygalactose transaminase